MEKKITERDTTNYLQDTKNSRENKTEELKEGVANFKLDSHQHVKRGPASNISESQSSLKATQENKSPTSTKRVKTVKRKQDEIKSTAAEQEEKGLNVHLKHSKGFNAIIEQSQGRDKSVGNGQIESKNVTGVKVAKEETKSKDKGERKKQGKADTPAKMEQKQNKAIDEDNLEECPKCEKWDIESTGTEKGKLLRLKFKRYLSNNQDENLIEKVIRANMKGANDNQETEGKEIMILAEDGTITCNFCPFFTLCKVFFWRHWGSNHGKQVKSYFCSLCGLSYKVLCSLKRHICLKHKVEDGNNETKSISKNYQCNMCFKFVSTRRNLDEHKLKVHNYVPIKYKCSNCEFETERCSTLHRHQRAIHNTEYYCCEKCVKPFYNLADYKAHVCKTQPRRIKCHLCEKTFSSVKCTQAHVKVHNNQWLYTCDKCGKKFAKVCQLKRHHNIKHEKEVIRYNCGDCFSSFLYKTSLQKHMRIAHLAITNSERKRYLKNTGAYRSLTKVKNIKCPKCSCAFYVKGALKNHMMRKHLYQPDEDNLSVG
ncbi:zinc finger protein 58-like [Ruditapes philippinarum]|uniref:zinc finger protein 58-like n=1 Tax=Ruditapes philippinarum TaxID=129788 RepID=UPI00295AA0F3|nr:zinc finger protein 58-like [Ruditapes philippinarum]